MLRDGQGQGAESIASGQSRALALRLALNARAIRAHAEGPLRSSDLEGTLGWAPQTNLRAAVANLCYLGVLARLEPDGSSKGTITELTEAGRDLLASPTGTSIGCCAPAGPISLDGAAAPDAIRALIAGWDSDIARSLAERSLTLTELEAEIADLSFPALERRLARLRSTNLLTRTRGEGKGKPYEVSDWLCHAMPRSAPPAAGSATTWPKKRSRYAKPRSRPRSCCRCRCSRSLRGTPEPARLPC